jgi:NADH-quinone oxidoreductase subunit L
MSASTEVGIMGASVLLAVAGMFAAWGLYANRGPEGDSSLSGALRGLYDSMAGAYHVDDIYGSLVVQPLSRLSTFLWKTIDVVLIDGVANGTATVAQGLGDSWRHWSTGNVQHYMLTVLLGLAAVLVVVVMAV